KVTATIKLYSSSEEEARLSNTAIVYGTVTDAAGEPVKNALVRIQVFSGGESYYKTTDEFGKYTISLPSMDDIKSLFGEQDLLYNS
ncbi:MAG: carboxypeptidase-like regulatory domain-containing protein, partial [Nanoarchaeota archaeon]|nr:carboxypeptidase-like regulatory domain-containing protein [Nanoarchaeota archaeon]